MAVGGLESDLQVGPGRNYQVQAEGQSAPADVLCSSLMEGSRLTLEMADHWQVCGDPDDSLPHHSFPAQQIFQGSVLVGGCPLKRQAVDRAVLRPQRLRPNDPALHRNAVLVRPKNQRKVSRGINGVGNLQAGSPDRKS